MPNWDVLCNFGCVLSFWLNDTKKHLLLQTGQKMWLCTSTCASVSSPIRLMRSSPCDKGFLNCCRTFSLRLTLGDAMAKAAVNPMSRLVGLGIEVYFRILQNKSLQLPIGLLDGEFSSPPSSLSLTTLC